MHSTNYYNVFIEIADDSPINQAAVPPVKGDKRTVANYQFDMLYDHPYKYTSDEVIYTVFATRKEIPDSEWEEGRQQFFSKGQPCFRSSPLTKRYGWGVHSDGEGRIAIFAAGSAEYQALLADDSVKKVKAMRSKRAGV